MKRIQITDALAAKRAFGHPITGVFATELPIVADVGHIKYVGGSSYPDERAPAEVEAWLVEQLPRHARGTPVTEPGQVQRRLQRAGTPKSELDFRFAFEACALSPEWFPPSAARDAAAAEPDSLWPWGAEGERLDQGVAELDAAGKPVEQAAAEAARIAALPNTRTLNDGGFVGVFVPLGCSVTSWPRILQPSPEFPVNEAVALASAIKVDGGHIFVFAKSDEFAGLEWPRGPIENTSCSITTSYVPKRMPAKAPKMTPAWLDMRRADDKPITSFRDGRTAAGEKAEQDLRKRMPRLAATAGKDQRMLHGRLFVQMAVRGLGLSRKLTKYVYADEGGMLSEARVDALIDDAIAGHRSWFSPDECYRAPDATFVERFMSWFSSDKPWVEAIEAATEGKEEITTPELEAAIVRAGVVKTAFTNDDAQRVKRLLTDAGWTKERTQKDGARSRTWTRKVPASDACTAECRPPVFK